MIDRYKQDSPHDESTRVSTKRGEQSARPTAELSSTAADGELGLTQSFWASGENAYGDVPDAVANDRREARRI